MSRTAASQYEIGRIGERCAASGVEFKPGDPFVAVLIHAKDTDALERRDYTPAAWSGMARPAGFFASWAGVTPTGEKPRGAVIDTSSLLGLFETLSEAEDPKRLAFRYVLALILLRKRVLLPAGSVGPKGNEPGALLVRVRGSAPEDRPIEVVDPAMDEQTVTEITEELRTLLRIES